MARLSAIFVPTLNPEESIFVSQHNEFDVKSLFVEIGFNLAKMITGSEVTWERSERT